MTFLTRSRVTADTGLPGDFLETSWGLPGDFLGTSWGLPGDFTDFCQLCLLIESVPKKYERKVKPEAFSSTGTSDC